MKTLLCFVALFLSSLCVKSESYAQQGWDVDTVKINVTGMLTGVEFTSPNAGVIVGDTTLKTTDGGKHWLSVGTPIGWYGQRYGFAAIHCFDSSNWVGVSTSSFRTTDAGQNWIFDSLYLYSINLWAVEFVGSNGLAAGNNSTILRSSNGGARWETVSGPVYGPGGLTFFGIAPATVTDWIVVGGDPTVPYGVILRSTDGGTKWDTVLHTRNRTVTSVSFPSALVGYASADSIYRTSDGGVTWVGTSPIPISVNGMSFKDPAIGTLVGSSGRIYRTRDAGAHWTEQTSNTPMDLRAVCFIDTSSGWAVGYRDVVVRTTNGGWGRLVSIDEVPAEIPGTFSLLQNYPNPFNPSTTIKYTVGGTGGEGRGAINTRLVVYDLLGREVVVLVNEPKAPGTYQMSFSTRGGDGSGLASGVYIYRLTAGTFVQSRKMVLLK